MTTHDFIIALFYAVDQERLEVTKHPEAKLYPSEVVTLALLFAVKGGGMRAFSRWLTRDYLPLFPQVPERTRLARLFKTGSCWIPGSWICRVVSPHRCHPVLLEAFIFQGP
jgi:hypothetical protein